MMDEQDMGVARGSDISKPVDYNIHVLAAVLIGAGSEAGQGVADDEDALLSAFGLDLAYELHDQASIRAVGEKVHRRLNDAKVRDRAAVVLLISAGAHFNRRRRF